MSQVETKIQQLAQTVLKAESLILGTHRMSDGDGLGSLLAMYHSLKKINKPVLAYITDTISDKYDFLSTKKYIKKYDDKKNTLEPTELALIFDTNDYRLLEPLYAELEKKCEKIIYIDHHPILKEGPKISSSSIIDHTAASAGEICYSLLKEMKIEMDTNIAQALYTSIVFDTQRFQFIKNSNKSYKICSKLYPYVEDNDQIYQQLFGVTSIEKIQLLADTIKNTEYFYQNKVAIINISKEELRERSLDIEDACDFLDISTGVSSTEICVLIILLSEGEYKLSFRSKKWDVSKLAQEYGGGGHKASSGATLINYKGNPKEAILQTIENLMKS